MLNSSGVWCQLKQLSLVLSIISLNLIPTSRAETLLNNLEDPTGYFTENSLSFYDNKLNFDQYVSYSMRSLSLVAGFDNDIHRYDSKQDLIDSFRRNLSYLDDLSGLRANIDLSESELLHDQSELVLIENELNQENCARQLDIIFEESLKLFKNFQTFSTSKQLQLIDFLDSFGSAPGGHLMMGNFLWLGSHEQCVQAQFKTLAETEPIRTSTSTGPNLISGRYCVANLRSPSWTLKAYQNASRLGGHSIKLGICLPKTCNSLSIRRHSNRIEALIKVARLQAVPLSTYKLDSLFCLPDEDSPLRQLSPSARLFVATLLVWLTFLLYFSLKQELESSVGQTSRQSSKWARVFAFRLAWQQLFGTSEHVKQQETTSNQTTLPFHETIQASQHFAALNGTKPSLIDGPHGHLNGKSSIDIVREDLATSQVPVAQPEKQTQQTRVSLAAIDGIKVLSMVWLISGHTMLFFIRTISNGRDFWAIIMDPRFMTILAGIFPVDSFFTVTGVLTAYLKFSKDNGRPMASLKYWMEAFVHRYLRFMPMYIIIFWYTRDVSQYIGFGPLWDYATADTSLRSMCKQESALVPLFFQANFKPLDLHCVKPAWYLANDYQYLLITPIFMGLMMCSKWLGYVAIIVSIGASLVMQFMTVFYSQDFTDFGAIINFRPMFATYVLKNLWQLYVLPYNRIAPYLVGLITGHMMYCVNKQHQRRVSSDGHVVMVGAATVAAGSPLPDANVDVHVDDNHQLRESQESLASSSSSSASLSHQGSSDNIIRSSPTTNKTTQNSRRDSTTAKKQQQSTDNNDTHCNYLSALIGHVCIKVWTPLILLISIIYLPLVTKLTTQEGQGAKIGASLIIALMRFVWSLAIARLIYICATQSISKPTSNSFIIRFLSSPMWKPWSKIGLSVLLIQWEIISYFAQTQSSPPVMTISFLLAVVLICIVATYALGLLVYLTIEYPLSQIEHLFVHPRFFNNKDSK